MNQLIEINFRKGFIELSKVTRFEIHLTDGSRGVGKRQKKIYSAHLYAYANCGGIDKDFHVAEVALKRYHLTDEARKKLYAVIGLKYPFKG